MRLARFAVAALLLTALGSCSFAIPLDAVFINGRLGFILAAEGRGSGLCPYQLTIGDSWEDVWEFEKPLNAQSEPCEDWLPLIYGQPPPGRLVTIAARRLRLDRVYVILDTPVEAAFRLRRVGSVVRVENVPWEGPEAQAAVAAASARRDQRSRERGEAFQRELQNTSEVIFEDAPLPPEQH